MQKKPSKEKRAEDLADRIKAVRKHLGLTQAQFSQQIGVSRSYLSEVESKKGKPTIEMVLGIADTFNDIRPGWLLTGAGNMLASLSELLFSTEQGELIFYVASEIVYREIQNHSKTVPPRSFVRIIMLLMDVMDGAYSEARVELGAHSADEAVRRALAAGQRALRSPEVRSLIGIE